MSTGIRLFPEFDSNNICIDHVCILIRKKKLYRRIINQ